MVKFLTILVLFAAVIWVVRRFRTGGQVSVHPSAKTSPRLTDSGNFEVGDFFFCDTARSPDGRYVVGASDGFVDERGRSRKGACALKEQNTGKIIFVVPLTRGNNPHVNSSGQVFVEDWKDQSRTGAMVSFDITGKRMWTKHFKANLFTSGLSEDGCRIFVSTCNSDYPAHSGKTFFLDAATGEVLWKRDGWGDVRFSGNTLGVDLEAMDGTKIFFAFDEHGALPSTYREASDAISAEKERGQYWAVIPKAQAALNADNPDLATAKRLLAELEGKEEEIPEQSRARILRLRGEIAEAEGDSSLAINCWQRALEIDPKVGIRRRYNALLSKVST